MNRRGFIKLLGATSPMIFLPKLIEVPRWKRYMVGSNNPGYGSWDAWESGPWKIGSNVVYDVVHPDDVVMTGKIGSLSMDLVKGLTGLGHSGLFK